MNATSIFRWVSFHFTHRQQTTPFQGFCLMEMDNYSNNTPSVFRSFSGIFSSNAAKNSLILLAFGLVLLNWYTADITKNNLQLAVNPPLQIAFFESHYLYFYMHAFSFIPVFLMSFDKKVAFFKTFKHLFPALFIVAAIFWIWDIAKTDSQVWGFNPTYYTQLLINLPIEEWLFFITFPYCVTFIYACLNAYFPNDTLEKFDRPLSMLFGFGFLAVGLLFWKNSYTATTWIPAGLFALWHFWRFPNTYRTRFYRAFIVGLVPFFLVNSVFAGIATKEPLVIYNPEEYFGVRIGVIPLDDFVYNFLLEFMVIYFFELKPARFLKTSLV